MVVRKLFDGIELFPCVCFFLGKTEIEMDTLRKTESDEASEAFTICSNVQKERRQKGKQDKSFSLCIRNETNEKDCKRSCMPNEQSNTYTTSVESEKKI